MRGLKAAARELAAAMAVIAVFALAFVYQPYMPTLLHQAGNSALVSNSFICGGSDGDQGHIDHHPCHACREYTAALPPPSDTFAPAFDRSVAVVYVAGAKALTPILSPPHYNPRAPPFAV